jgi:hypothetical protein
MPGPREFRLAPKRRGSFSGRDRSVSHRCTVTLATPHSPSSTGGQNNVGLENRKSVVRSSHSLGSLTLRWASQR